MLNTNPNFRRGFTIMEMIVSVGILVIVILSVGVIFQNAGRTVGVSQSSMEMLSGVRAIQQQLESDLSGLDRDAFLVIRCGTFTDTGVTPNVTRRCDQISFISRGSFPNRTGTENGFTDNLVIAPTAFVWWGQLAIATPDGPVPPTASPLDPRTYLNSTQLGANYKVPTNQVPTGLVDGDFILGRHTTLLMVKNSTTNNIKPAGQFVASYQPSSSPLMAAIDHGNTQTPAPPSTSEAGYDITQSRIAVAQQTPAQIMSVVMQGLGGSRGTAVRFEAEKYCYRYAALKSPYDGVDASGKMNLVNGYYRMHPIALQGVSSIAIDWTDGSTYAGGETDVTTGQPVTGDLTGSTRWFGSYNSSSGLAQSGTFASHIVDPFNTVATSSPDDYTAAFSYDNKKKWPVAIRFRYHVADPSNRLQGGRDFVQIIKLPS